MFDGGENRNAQDSRDSWPTSRSAGQLLSTLSVRPGHARAPAPHRPPGTVPKGPDPSAHCAQSLGLGLGSSRSSSALGSGSWQPMVSSALRSGSAPAPSQPLANFPAATLGGGGEGGGVGAGAAGRGRGEPRVRALALAQRTCCKPSNPLCETPISLLCVRRLLCGSAPRAPASPPLWHTEPCAGPDPDSDPTGPFRGPSPGVPQPCRSNLAPGLQRPSAGES